MGLFSGMLMYLYLLGSQAAPGDLALPGLSAGQFVAMSLASSMFISLPLDALLTTLLYLALRADTEGMGGRFPELAKEVKRREAAYRVLGEMTTQELMEACGVVKEVGGEGKVLEERKAAMVEGIQGVNATPPLPHPAPFPPSVSPTCSPCFWPCWGPLQCSMPLALHW
jgi:hypothetical protein